MGRDAGGIWLVNKPEGPTSFETLAQVRDRFALRKACHGGALDPFASGLLPVLAGPAVHVFELLHELPKTYVARVQWGAETDNGDLLGKVVATGDATALTPTVLDEALRGQLGWRDQVPPRFSNKRVGKDRAWQRAQAGEVFELPPEREYLHAARWRAHDLPRTSELELTCRGGFYVRALARDLGVTLQARAHLSALKRTAIGPWECPSAEPLQLPLVHALTWLPRRELTDAEVGQLRQRQPLARGKVIAPSWNLPFGFPPPAQPLTLGVHQGRAAVLLDGAGAVKTWMDSKRMG